MLRIIGVVIVFAVMVNTSAAQGKKKPDNTVDPRVAMMLDQLFKRWDLNKDTFLDKAELAKAFRGPAAKPPAEPKETDKPKEADKPKEGDKPGTPAKPTAELPDVTFLENYDTDKDGKISRTEFDAYGLFFEQQIKEAEELQEKIEKANKELQKKLNDQQRRQFQQVQQRNQRELQDLYRKMNEEMRRQMNKRG